MRLTPCSGCLLVCSGVVAISWQSLLVPAPIGRRAGIVRHSLQPYPVFVIAASTPLSTSLSATPSISAVRIPLVPLVTPTVASTAPSTTVDTDTEPSAPPLDPVSLPTATCPSPLSTASPARRTVPKQGSCRGSSSSSSTKVKSADNDDDATGGGLLAGLLRQRSNAGRGPSPIRVPFTVCDPAPTDSDMIVRDICSAIRYCDPQAGLSTTWKGSDGAVQQDEVEAVLSQLQAVQSVIQNGQGNLLADGTFGQAVLMAGMLFETTLDIRALDQAVRMADNILELRNDPVTGRVMWTGQRELIWPTKDGSGDTAQYAGSEQMDIVGHMVNAATYILRLPCLWTTTPQINTGPTTFSTNVTYLDRALAYVSTAEETFDSYFAPHFFASNGSIIQPDDPRWNELGDLPAGQGMPWNRRFMIIHGMIRLATVASIPGPTFNSTRSTQLAALIDINVREFIDALEPTTSAVDGSDTFAWTYTVASSTNVEAVYGIHALYDIWGLFIAWQFGSAPDVLNDRIMSTLANTLVSQIWNDSTKTYMDFVDGTLDCSGKQSGTTLATVQSLWAQYSRWNDRVYDIVNRGSTSQLQRSVPLLWVKRARSLKSDRFWRRTQWS